MNTINDKTLIKPALEKILFNLIKSIYKKFTVYTIFSKKLIMFCLKHGMSRECLLSPLLFNIILEVQISAISGKKERKLFLVADDIIMCVKS